MKQAKRTVLLFLIVYGMTALSVMFKKPEEFSVSERRRLLQKPDISFEALVSASYMRDMEAYVTDRFPLREKLHGIKSLFSMGVMRKQDMDNIYYKDGYLAKMEYPMNLSSIEYASKIFNKINGMYFEGTDIRPYLCMIPDKNYFLSEEEYLSMDYELFIREIEKQNRFLTPISIMEDIQLTDFYRTDTHWRQERIADIAEKIASAMETKITGEYNVFSVEEPFYGVYYGQISLPIVPDDMNYCSNEILESCFVYDFENKKEIPMYDIEKAKGRDPYELFLGGNISVVSIDNQKSASEKELIVFGDSFSRCLVPLLAEGYKKTILIDIRYLPAASVGDFVDFANQDVLFLYSIQVLNNSITLK